MNKPYTPKNQNADRLIRRLIEAQNKYPLPKFRPLRTAEEVIEKWNRRSDGRQ